MRMILALATAVMMASCTTSNMNGGAITGIAADAPRTPPAFRKPPPQVNHWGAGVGYGGRY